MGILENFTLEIIHDRPPTKFSLLENFQLYGIIWNTWEAHDVCGNDRQYYVEMIVNARRDDGRTKKYYI